MRFDIVTIFPAFFSGMFEHGVVKRAIQGGLLRVAVHDLRAFTHDRHRTVDDRPFGGGEGMVLKPQPIHEALQSLSLRDKPARAATHPQREAVILLSAQGRRFTQSTARRLATLDRVVLLCGRYEGVDERVSELFCDEELSIGDYVLSGADLAAAILLDATVRLLPGVLGHADSSRYESFGEGDEPADTMTEDGVPRSTHGAGGLLDYPHYTRPAEFRGVPIPEVLGNGDHSVIRKWRRQAQLIKTLTNRPDLFKEADLSENDREFLSMLGYTAH